MERVACGRINNKSNHIRPVIKKNKYGVFWVYLLYVSLVSLRKKHL